MKKVLLIGIAAAMTIPLIGCSSGLSTSCVQIGDSYVSALLKYGQLNRQFESDRDNDKFADFDENREAFSKVEEARSMVNARRNSLEAECGTAGLEYANNKLLGER